MIFLLTLQATLVDLSLLSMMYCYITEFQEYRGRENASPARGIINESGWSQFSEVTMTLINILKKKIQA